ncbi:hypothetical protein LK459_11575 [Gordonia otitidis]|uniref:hypothetical protein n=1 Tax=Gordonia otitidis TaxID=249058 RepID=UPI001D15A0F6|nr:hypothetical protein [Gordonia otitidis]UEA61389.1 hypothetical protein LK459_11575 [Gordonia otitidis]
MTQMTTRSHDATADTNQWWTEQPARIAARLAHQPTVCADITRCDCGWYTHGRPPVRARRYRHHLQRVGAA